MKKLFAPFALIYLYFSTPVQALAIDLNSKSDCFANIDAGGTSVKAFRLTCIPYIFQNAITWLLTFAGAVALFLLIYGGIRFITSGGDAKQLDGARKTITYAIAGLVLILFSFFIISVIGYVTGANCIKVFGFNSCG